MAVYKRTYKAYSGPRTPAWSRFTVLSRYGFSTLFSSRPFTAYTVLCFVPGLVGLAFIYVLNSASVQTLLHVRFGETPVINNYWFIYFLLAEGWMGFILTAWGAPGMVSKDFANHSIQLYLSRPLSRAEYILGKVSAIVALLSCTTWVPALFLFVLQAQLRGHGWGRENLWMAGAIVVSCLLGIAVLSLISMAVAVWVRWRIAATALMLGIFFLLPGLGRAFNFILRTRWGMLLDLGYVLTVVSTHLFRIGAAEGAQDRFSRWDLIPLWSAWATLLAVCAACLWALSRRLKAREVERA